MRAGNGQFKIYGKVANEFFFPLLIFVAQITRHERVGPPLHGQAVEAIFVGDGAFSSAFQKDRRPNQRLAIAGVAYVALDGYPILGGKAEGSEQE